MTGAEFKALMKLRRLKTIPLALALDVNPQTIRNLWKRDEVPRLYLMALSHYIWAVGGEAIALPGEGRPRVGTKPALRSVAELPTAKAVFEEIDNQELAVTPKENLWSKLG